MASDPVPQTDSPPFDARAILRWRSADFAALTERLAGLVDLSGQRSAVEHDLRTLVRQSGLMLVGLSPLLGGVGLGTTASTAERLHWLLAAVGEADLSLACLYEQHLSSLMFIERHGDVGQVQRAARDARDGHVFAIWDVDAADNPVRIENGKLCGSKLFAVGAGRVTRPLVTARGADGRRRVFLLTATDAAYWINPRICRMIGMLDAASHSVTISGVDASAAEEVGAPDAIASETWQSVRSLRVSATRVGALKGLAHDVEASVTAAGSVGPYQLHRIAELAVEVEGAFAWLERAGVAPFALAEAGGAAEIAAYVHMARCAIERAIDHVVRIAQQALGAEAVSSNSRPAGRIGDLIAGAHAWDDDEALSMVGDAVLSRRASLGRFIEVVGKA